MKSKQNLLPRGFVSKSERLAESLREQLGVHPCGYLCAFELAAHLGVSVCEATDYGIDSELLERLTGWSGLYLINEFGEKIIIHNASHPVGRQQSTLMHELAHIICEHRLPTQVIIPELSFLRHYEPQHEQEADCLGATLQITRKGLVWAMRRGMSIVQIAQYFSASNERVEHRLNISGVAKQFASK